MSYFLGDASFFKSIITTTIEAISNAQYSQKQEKQADKIGLILLDKTYGQVAGATDFFATLSKKQNSNLDFLSSHPAPAKRIKAINKVIKQNKYSSGILTPLPDSLKID